MDENLSLLPSYQNDYSGMARDCENMLEKISTYLRKFPRNYYPLEFAQFEDDLNQFIFHLTNDI